MCIRDRPCSVKSPENTVMQNPKTHFVTLLKDWHSPLKFKFGETEETTETAKKIFIRGTRTFAAKREMAFPVPTMIRL